MIAPNIELSEHSKANMRLRDFYNNMTCLPPGTPTEWDRKLKDYDPELSLRYNPRTGNFLIFYDHQGKLSVIRAFGRYESFGKAFLNLKHNSTLNLRKLKKMRADFEEETEKEIDHQIDECAEEFATELHHATRERVITDGVKDNNY